MLINICDGVFSKSRTSHYVSFFLSEGRQIGRTLSGGGRTGRTLSAGWEKKSRIEK